MQLRLKISKKKSYWFAIIVTLGIVAFNASFRGIIDIGYIMNINWMVVLAFMLLKLQSVKLNKVPKRVLIYTLIWLFLLFVLILTMQTNSVFNVEYIISIGLPPILVFVSIGYSDSIKDVVHIWTSMLNIVMIIVLLGGIVDLISGYQMTDIFATIYNTEAINQMRIDEPNRIITFLGHPLFASEIALINTMFIIIREKYFEHDKFYLLRCGAALGVAALSGSKAVFFLILVLMLYSNFSIKKIRNILGMLIVIYVLYAIGIFDIVIGRFMISIEAGDLTTGRNTHLLQLYQAGQLQFYWFKGHASTFSENVIIALEYPLLRLSYRYGIFYTLCLYFVIMGYPMVKLIRRKQFGLFVTLLALIIDVNVYSGIASNGDGMLVYCVVVFLVLNISEYIWKTKKVCIEQPNIVQNQMLDRGDI